MKMTTGMLFVFNFWKGRRKDKDSPTPPLQDEYRQYLEDQCVRDRITNTDFYRLVSLPECLDYNEWLATHAVSFFNHVNLMYGVISEYCTGETCATMTGPGNVQFCWTDEKGKKSKESAAQYIDYVTTYIQKTISDESIFPTKFGHPFPTTFEATVKRIHKYLLHIIAHIYHVHYKELLMLGLNGHMNSLFTHFMVFNIKFDLLEEKDYDMLNELLKALIKQLPDPNQNDGSEVAPQISRT
ncbi:MOB kinase activator 2-like isoform X2 [Mercenaria mercenaria]|uniref:MOB kinase activator 2-like isoform X2 n=1 Tax=Mercenaria mercenaria TaxID=6596 RepID=UPI00234EEA31|nr:MOB kinase activator 2-like isoform X2 [Mercenaria mercenaria]XP_053385294.1 MOB kinase activator 2-like isoform X2 [Mercenaria mercenaria]